MRVYHKFDSEEKGRVLPRFKEQYACKIYLPLDSFRAQCAHESKYNSDKYAGIVNRGGQRKYQFLGRKQKARNRANCTRSMDGLARAQKKPFEQTIEEAKQVCEPYNAHVKKKNTRYQFKALIGTLRKDASFLRKTVEYRTMQVPSQNSSRLVHPVKWLYPPFQSAPTMAPSTHMYGIRRENEGKHSSAQSARIVMDVLAQANAINVPPHQVSLVAEKPISPAPQPFPAFVLNGKPTNTMAKSHRTLTEKIHDIAYDDTRYQQNTEAKRNAQMQAPWHGRAIRPFNSIHDICKNILEDAKNHLCETDYRQLLVLLGEVWKATKRQGSDMNFWISLV